MKCRFHASRLNPGGLFCCFGFQLLQCYPNPVSANINLEFASSQPEQLVFNLVNTLGQTVRHSRFLLPQGSTTQSIPVHDLPAGAYWLHLAAEHSLLTKQVFIQR
jgi:hypothetical protein